MSYLSQIFLCAVAAFLFGVFIASYIPVNLFAAHWFIICGALILFAGFWFFRAKFFLFAVAVIFTLTGVLRYVNFAGVPVELTEIFSERVIVSGVIAGEPKLKKAQEIVLEVRNINHRGIPEPFRALIFLRPYPRYELGDALSAEGKFEIPENYNDFDYRAYLEKDGIYAVSYYPDVKKISDDGIYSRLIVKKQLVNLKNIFIEKIKSIFPEPHAAYLAGILVGDRSGIPADIYDQFKRTGVAHVVALSGFNISIIAATLLFILEALAIPYVVSGALMTIAIIVFVLMVGGEPSIVRAAVMGIIAVVARQSFRAYDAGRALFAAAALMVFFNPKLLRFDIGFQLSFAATAGIIFLQPFIAERLAKIKWQFFRQLLATTLAAEIAVTPMLMFYFGGVSLVAPLVNVLIVPSIAAAMLFGFVTAILGFISTKLAFLVFPFAWALLAYNLWVVSRFADLNFAYAEVSFGCVVGLFLSACFLVFVSRFFYAKIS